MYFVGVSSSAPYDVDMSHVFSFDSGTMTMKRHDVITLGMRTVSQSQCFGSGTERWHPRLAQWLPAIACGVQKDLSFAAGHGPPDSYVMSCCTAAVAQRCQCIFGGPRYACLMSVQCAGAVHVLGSVIAWLLG